MKTAENVAAWTPERVETLKRLWGEGLSAAQISRQIPGTTRNSVIAKVYRLRNAGADLSERAAPAAPSVGRVAPKPVAAPKPAAPPLLIRTPSAVVPAPSAAIPSEINELSGSGQSAQSCPIWDGAVKSAAPTQSVPFGSPGCKWPISGEGADTRQCGAQRDGDRSYCATHAEVAYQKPKPGQPKNGNEMMRALRRWAA